MGSKARIRFEKPSQLGDERRREVIDFLRDYSGDEEAVIAESITDCDRLILYEDSDTGQVCGTTRLKIVDLEAARKRFRALVTMSVVIAEEYRGQNLIQRAGLQSFLRYGMWTFRRVYWFSLMSGFRAYLLAARYMPDVWPHRSRSFPGRERQVYEGLLEELFGELWDRDRGVTRRYRGSMKEKQLEVPEKIRRRDPDVRYFCEQNPGYSKGEGLPVLVRLRLLSFVVMMWRMVTRRFR